MKWKYFILKMNNFISKWNIFSIPGGDTRGNTLPGEVQISPGIDKSIPF